MISVMIPGLIRTNAQNIYKKRWIIFMGDLKYPIMAIDRAKIPTVAVIHACTTSTMEPVSSNCGPYTNI